MKAEFSHDPLCSGWRFRRRGQSLPDAVCSAALRPAHPLGILGVSVHTPHQRLAAAPRDPREATPPPETQSGVFPPGIGEFASGVSVGLKRRTRSSSKTNSAASFQSTVPLNFWGSSCSWSKSPFQSRRRLSASLLIRQLIFTKTFNTTRCLFPGFSQSFPPNGHKLG